MLVAICRTWVAAGRSRMGIGMLWEVLRYQVMISTTGDEFRLNNDFRSRYARLIMASERDLADVFEVRQLRAE
jgi:hypothetical protein